MKNKFDTIILSFILSCTIIISGCHKEKIPELSTVQVTEISATTAVSGGKITSDGNVDIIVRGVCWSTKKSPTIDGTRTTDGYGIGEFVSSITQLTPGTLYHVRAYATNSVGTAYGNDITFTTSQMTLPVLTTVTVTGITQTSAISGGNISSDGGSQVIERGICWSTASNPDITDSKTSNGTGTGTFSANLTGLTGNTVYHVRAYATNSEGTSYGDDISFSTSPVIPAVTTTDPEPTSTTTGKSGGNITSDGGSAVTERGVCWSTSANPTIINNRTSDGTGTGSFDSNITGLAVNTLYHVRAYATNDVGTAYGTDKTFTTDPAAIADKDGNSYDVIRIGTQLWLKQNLKTTKFNDGTAITLVTDNTAWGNLSTQGYCWYDNNAATYRDPYGAIYNWYAVNSGKLCPSGWHVPTDDDCSVLEYYLEGPTVAGGKLKETGTSHWTDPNTDATNETGFTALPGGYRTETGQFGNINDNGFWWTSTLSPTSSDPWFRRLQFDSGKAYRNFYNEKYGMSVRCIKD